MKKLIPLLGIITLYSCKSNNQNQVQGPAEFPVIEVTQRAVTAYQEFPVSIRGINNNDIRAKIQGYIQKLYVDEGQRVSKGTPLFQLETNILTQSADAAKAGVSASTSNVEAARAAVEVAEVEVKKLAPLVEKNIIGGVQLETAKANVVRAQAALAQAVASEGQAKSNLRGLQENINFSIVRSPISGVVGALPFREGSLVGPTDQIPLTTVSDVSQLYAYFSMNEKEYLDFLESTPGNTVKEKLNNIPAVDLVLANGQIYSEKGEVQAVTGQIDASTGSIQFRVTFGNSQGLLSNGNSGKIRIPKTYSDAIVFPEMATFERQGIIYVYTVVQDTARLTMVKIADRANNLVVIEEGVKPGDLVVTEGVNKIKDKAAIKPKKVDLDEFLGSLKTFF